MPKAIITMVDKSTGQRWIFHEVLRRGERAEMVRKRLIKLSPELRFVKMTIQR